jgi:hypothetical protein
MINKAMNLKLLFFGILSSALISCKETYYLGNMGQSNQTQVVLSHANFRVLGSFKGIATEKKRRISIKDKEGIISKAKSALLASAKASGIELTGSRTLINLSVDIIQNRRRVTATVTGEIIEFTK